MSETDDVVCRSLTIVDAEGKPKISMQASSESHPVMFIHGEGSSALVLSVDRTTVRLEFRRAGGLPALTVATHEEGATIATYDKQGRHIAAVLVSEQGCDVRMQPKEPGGEVRRISI